MEIPDDKIREWQKKTAQATIDIRKASNDQYKCGFYDGQAAVFRELLRRLEEAVKDGD